MKDKFRAALQIIHNFVHEDSDTLKMAPLCSNVEYAYTSQLLLLQDILHTSFIIDVDWHRSALQVIWWDSLELNIIQLVKSYTGGQTSVVNVRMVMTMDVIVQ